MSAARALEVVVKKIRSGDEIVRTTITADPKDTEQLTVIMVGLLAAERWPAERAGEFEMKVRHAGDRSWLTTIRAGAS
jgi:hypothetical protein